jgi:hypothetical protein
VKKKNTGNLSPVSSLGSEGEINQIWTDGKHRPEIFGNEMSWACRKHGDDKKFIV